MEGIILLSCAVFSVLITRKVRFSSKINVLIVAFFAFFHGFAHGQEISTSASLISYTLGFMLATLLLHGAGILVAKLVVLAITCMLTVLFSDAALAKTTESIIDFKDKNAALAQDAGSSKIDPLWKTYGQRGYKSGQFVFNDEDLLDTEDLYKYGDGESNATCKLISLHADITKAPQKSNSKDIKASGNYLALVLEQAACQALDNCRDKLFFNLDYIINSRLDFKHYYPDINHTPGRHFLSNGVGLTSPPALFTNVLAPQYSPAFCKTPNSSSEDHSLQLSFAKFNLCNSKTTHLCRHNYVLRNLRNALQNTVAITRCTHNFGSPLTTINCSGRPSSLVAEVISRFYFHNAISSSYSLTQLPAWHTKAFTFQT